MNTNASRRGKYLHVQGESVVGWSPGDPHQAGRVLQQDGRPGGREPHAEVRIGGQVGGGPLFSLPQRDGAGGLGLQGEGEVAPQLGNLLRQILIIII